MHIVTSPWRSDFEKLVGSAKKTLRVVVPFYGERAIYDLLTRPPRKVKKFFLFALSKRCVSEGYQSVAAIQSICADRFAQVRFLKGLHAKFIIVDDTIAVVTSANLTGGGLESNLEMGVWIDDAGTVRELTRHFDAHWDKAKPIDSKTLKFFNALPRQRYGGRGSDKAFGARVKIRTQTKRPPSPDTPRLGWVLFHAAKSYEGSKYKSPIDELNREWKPRARQSPFDWNWKGTPMKENSRPHKLLLAWEGKVFGEATATITREISPEMRADDYTFAFLFSDFEWAQKEVSIEELGIGEHRSFVRLTEKMLATYHRRQRAR